MKKYKKCLFRKNYIQRFAKKRPLHGLKYQWLLEYQLIDSAWPFVYKFGSVPDSLKKNQDFDVNSYTEWNLFVDIAHMYC